MNRALQTTFAAALVLPLASCETIPDVAGRLARLNGVCVTGYTAIFKPRVPGALVDRVEFQANLTNPQSEDAVGSLEVKMAVAAKNISIGTPPANEYSEGPIGFATPVTTVYPANVTNGYISPMLVSASNDPGVVYDIEIFINIPGLENDASPCHVYKRSNFRVPAA